MRRNVTKSICDIEFIPDYNQHLDDITEIFLSEEVINELYQNKSNYKDLTFTKCPGSPRSKSESLQIQVPGIHLFARGHFNTCICPFVK